MIRNYLNLLLLILFCKGGYSQIISTDPNNPRNLERPDLVSHFNWMNRIFSVYHPNGGYISGNGNPIQLGNPYYQRYDYLNHFNLFNYDLSLPIEEEPEKLYFHPKDGWELLHKNNGLMPDETTLITDPLINRVGPYYILYNKYTGKIRVLASFDGVGVNDKIVTTIKFKNPTSSAPDLKYSALFNNYGQTSQPLDQKTNVLEISEASKAAINKGFISADFQMSYDPCNCHNKSEMIIDFSSLNNAALTLDGRLLATSVQLNGSGDSPLLNREDYLTSVYKEGFSVNGGMLTYKNIDALVEKYEQPQLNDFEKAALAAIKSAIKGGTTAIDKNIINKGAAIVMNSIFSGIPFYDSVKTVGLGIMAAGAKSLTAELFPSHSIPNISFIEGEMVLTGTMEDETAFNNASINLAVPGSEGSENVQWQYYPTYNKTLGLFALLETPSVIYDEQEGEDESLRYDDWWDYKYYKLNSSLKYSFNPEANVSINETKVYGALELTLTNIEHPYPTETYTYYNKNKNLQPVVNTETHTNIWITPFVPIENLQDIVAKQLYYIDFDPDREMYNGAYKLSIDVKLKILIEYTFLPNSYGKINKTLQVFTYPVNLTKSIIASTSFKDLNSIPANWSSTNDFILNQSTQYRKEAWDKIEISHTIGVASNISGSQTYKAKEIILKPGANILSDVTLNTGLPLPDRAVSQPVSASYLTNFCSSTYKGNIADVVLKSTQITKNSLKSATIIDTLDNTQKIMTDIDYGLESASNILVYPNPTKDIINISFNNISVINVKLINLSGNILYEKAISKEPLNPLQFNLSSFDKGMYFIVIMTENKLYKEKIILM